MTPTSFDHALIESTLTSELRRFVHEKGLGWVVSGELGIYTRRNPDRVRGADIAFLSRQRVGERPQGGFLEVAPDLVVEIISPSDRWQDVREKLEEYFAIGVEQVWIVEPKSHSVLVHRSPTDFEKLDETTSLSGEGTLDGFTMPVEDLFRD